MMRSDNPPPIKTRLSDDPRGINRGLLSSWLGDGTVESSLEFEGRTLVAIVSSHRARDGFESHMWLRNLRTVLAYAKANHVVPMFAAATPYADVIEHACRRYRIPSLRLECRASTVRERLGRSKPAAKSTDANGLRNIGTVQTIRLLVEKQVSTAEMRTLPIHDRALFALADIVFVLALKTGGKIARLADERAKLEVRECSSVILPDSSGELTSPLFARRKMDGKDSHPAIRSGSTALEVESVAVPDPRPHSATIRPVTYQPIISARSIPAVFEPGRFLAHCTRARRGAWPDQTSEAYLDSILNGTHEYPATTLSSLARILKTGVLFATSALKRGDLPSVSFSARNLLDLLSLRRYERHLGRWDWEPYGLLIDRTVLIDLGAQAVTYRLKSNSKQTLEGDSLTQPFAVDGSGRDWRVEEEWRMMSNCLLANIPTNRAYVFVLDARAARSIQHLSRWPVLVVDP